MIDYSGSLEPCLFQSRALNSGDPQVSMPQQNLRQSRQDKPRLWRNKLNSRQNSQTHSNRKQTHGKTNSTHGNTKQTHSKANRTPFSIPGLTNSTDLRREVYPKNRERGMREWGTFKTRMFKTGKLQKWKLRLL